MKGQPAKIPGRQDIRRLLSAARSRRHPERNVAIVLLSTKAGLRACEISRATWRMVTDARGRIGVTLELPGVAAKKGSGLGEQPEWAPIDEDNPCRAIVRLY